MTNPIIIVGAGQAGLKAADTLRAKGHEGAIRLIGDEPWHPYQRPPLSKAYLKGEMDVDRLFFRPTDWFETANIELLRATRATAIDPAAKLVCLEDGRALAFSKLLLATGTRARKLPLRGASLAGVQTLRGIDDTNRIAKELEAAKNIVVIGGGFIGMEFAAAARSLGKNVSVVERESRILQRSVAPEMSEFLQSQHEAKGVNITTDVGVDRIEGTGFVHAVRLSNGNALPADLVIVAAGAVPCTQLAEQCGLNVERGIVVDQQCQTSAPEIYAAGDCSQFPSQRYGRSIALESVQNACDQAKIAAAVLMGEEAAYDPVPWFWSDQYDIKLQIAGLSEGYDRTETIGAPEEARFAIRYFAGSRLLAVHSINDARSHMMARRDLADQSNNLAA